MFDNLEPTDLSKKVPVFCFLVFSVPDIPVATPTQ